MDVSIPWVHRLTRIMRSGDVHRPDRPPTPGGGFTPMRLTQVTWEDIMTPEQILTLGTTRSSFIRASQAGRDRMQANLRWYLYEHLGYAPGENVAIPYTTLVWMGNLLPSEHSCDRVLLKLLEGNLALRGAVDPATAGGRYWTGTRKRSEAP